MRSKPLNAIDNARQPQAGVLACLDGFYRFAILAPAIIPPALLIRRSVASRGSMWGWSDIVP